MPIDKFEKTFLPQCDGYALDFIKTCAALFMVIDHIDAIWFKRSLFPLFLIGRATFPLFCYAVAIAVLRAKDGISRRYIYRMLALAALTQPLFYFSFDSDMTANVIFTLAAGAAVASATARLKLWQMNILYVAACLSMLAPAPLEFGLAGVMLPSALARVLRGETSAYPALLLLLVFINGNGFLPVFLEGKDLTGAVLVIVLMGLAATVLPWMTLDAARSLTPAPRFLPKYALHVFYPGHMLLLKLLAFLK